LLLLRHLIVSSSPFSPPDLLLLDHLHDLDLHCFLTPYIYDRHRLSPTAPKTKLFLESLRVCLWKCIPDEDKLENQNKSLDDDKCITDYNNCNLPLLFYFVKIYG